MTASSDTLPSRAHPLGNRLGLLRSSLTTQCGLRELTERTFCRLHRGQPSVARVGYDGPGGRCLRWARSSLSSCRVRSPLPETLGGVEIGDQSLRDRAQLNHESVNCRGPVLQTELRCQNVALASRSLGVRHRCTTAGSAAVETAAALLATPWSYMTAGVAIVGASVIAVTPIAPPPPASLRAADLAALSFSDIPTPNELIAALLESAPAGVAELLPSAAPGGAIGGVVSDVTEFIVALSAATGQSVATIALALGNLPGGILALTQAVIDDPTLLPNALSSLIHGGVDTLEAALAPIAGCSQPCPDPSASPRPPTQAWSSAPRSHSPTSSMTSWASCRRRYYRHL